MATREMQRWGEIEGKGKGRREKDTETGEEQKRRDG